MCVRSGAQIIKLIYAVEREPLKGIPVGPTRAKLLLRGYKKVMSYVDRKRGMKPFSAAILS